jgi:hypothetical protein
MSETPEKPEYFTIVFDGRLRDLKNNPFNVESPFGKVVAVGVGDALGRQEIVVELLDATIKARDLAESCMDAGIEEAEIGGCMESVPDLIGEFDCAINRTNNAV